MLVTSMEVSTARSRFKNAWGFAHAWRNTGPLALLVPSANSWKLYTLRSLLTTSRYSTTLAITDMDPALLYPQLIS